MNDANSLVDTLVGCGSTTKVHLGVFCAEERALDGNESRCGSLTNEVVKSIYLTLVTHQDP